MPLVTAECPYAAEGCYYWCIMVSTMAFIYTLLKVKMKPELKWRNGIRYTNYHGIPLQSSEQWIRFVYQACTIVMIVVHANFLEAQETEQSITFKHKC